MGFIDTENNLYYRMKSVSFLFWKKLRGWADEPGDYVEKFTNVLIRFKVRKVNEKITEEQPDDLHIIVEFNEFLNLLNKHLNEGLAYEDALRKTAYMLAKKYHPDIAQFEDDV